jgi:hypothetical protein
MCGFCAKVRRTIRLALSYVPHGSVPDTEPPEKEEPAELLRPAVRRIASE